MIVETIWTAQSVKMVEDAVFCITTIKTSWRNFVTVLN